MNRMRTSGTPTILFALIFTAFGWSQAKIDESKEKTHIFVDSVAGSDVFAGTATTPFKTIGRALAEANKYSRNGVGTRVTVNPGTYHESLNIGRAAGSKSAPMTIEAATAGTAVVSGADPWTGWTNWSGHSGVYTHGWSYRWGFCPTTPGVFEPPIAMRREMIFVNGANLTQVLTLGQLAPGTFYVDESHGTVYVQPAGGTDMSTADVEVSTRNSLLTAYNPQNLVVRGMTFAEANNCRDSAAAVMIYAGSQALIDSDQFNWNNAGGLQLSGVTNYTVQNSIADHNGESGFGAMQSKYGTWTNNEADYNTWRGAQGAIYGWNSGGFHFFQEHNNTLTNDTALFNQSHGVHWDTDTENVTSSGLVVGRNLRDGVLIEKSEGPLGIAGATVCSNNRIGLVYDGGVALRASTYVTIGTSSLFGNQMQQIPVVGIGNAPIQVVNYETGQVYLLQTHNLTMSTNSVSGGAAQQLFNDGFQKGTVWDNFRSTLGSDYNTWWNGSQSKPFTVPVPYQGTDVTFDNWRSTTGRDGHSSFAQPSLPTCPSSTESPDFWLVNQNQGSLSVGGGGTANFTMIVLPLAGFNGTTTFGQFGASTIPGVSSYKWSQPSVQGSGTVTFSVTMGYLATPGSYPITLSATSGGVTRTVTVFLNVN